MLTRPEAKGQLETSLGSYLRNPGGTGSLLDSIQAWGASWRANPEQDTGDLWLTAGTVVSLVTTTAVTELTSI